MDFKILFAGLEAKKAYLIRMAMAMSKAFKERIKR